MVLVGRLAINKYDKEVDGVKVEVQKPVLKLSSFHLCGPKPASKEKEAAAAGAA